MTRSDYLGARVEKGLGEGRITRLLASSWMGKWQWKLNEDRLDTYFKDSDGSRSLVLRSLP